MQTMTSDEAARGAALNQANAEARTHARERFGRLASLCGIDLDGIPDASAADVAHGLPILAAALETMAQRLAKLEAGKGEG